MSELPTTSTMSVKDILKTIYKIEDGFILFTREQISIAIAEVALETGEYPFAVSGPGGENYGTLIGPIASMRRNQGSKGDINGLYIELLN